MFREAYDWKRYRAEAVVGALALDERLAKCWAGTPNAVTLPTRSGRFRRGEALAVSLFFRANQLSATAIAQTLPRCVRVLLSRRLLKGLVAVGFMFNELEQGDVEGTRFLRVSLWPQAYSPVAAGAPLDLLRDEPADGVSCTWYVDADQLA